MATADVLRSPRTARPAFKPIFQHGVSASTTKPSSFDASKHLMYKEHPKVHTMKEIGFPGEVGISPVAVSEPFPLFSPEAIQTMRSEIFSKDVMDNCQYSSNIAACQLRGFAPKYASFVHDAWKSPETLAAISKVAGVDLVPVMDFEIAHINISVKSEKEKEQELEYVKESRSRMADEGIAGCPWEDDKPVVGWHTDSYPFVCVLMLSDCSTMVGGETALVTGTGEVLKVRGPQMGCAVVLQGRYITHQALRALGATERITMVTSFRPRSPLIRDDTVLTTVRPISNLSDLYSEFSEYRLEMLEERIRAQLKDIRDRKRAGKKFDTNATKDFLLKQEKFLAHTNSEMVEEDKVRKGYIEEVNLANVEVGEGEKEDRGVKRARPN
ncbi:MAG: hypothetical protein M1819_002253 [Sarea resinae]|nr:MAG: hypothetical protein M1819_002253 [Sarea resinae]